MLGIELQIYPKPISEYDKKQENSLLWIFGCPFL